MNRRQFIRGLVAGVATVAMASKLAPKFPEFRAVRLAYTITDEEIEDGLYGEIGERYAKALAESMMQTREFCTGRVMRG